MTVGLLPITGRMSSCASPFAFLEHCDREEKRGLQIAPAPFFISPSSFDWHDVVIKVFISKCRESFVKCL